MAQQLIINLHTNIDQGNGMLVNTKFNYNMLTTDPPPTIPVKTTSQTPFFTNILDIASLNELSDNFFFNILNFKRILQNHRPRRAGVLNAEEKAKERAEKVAFAEQNTMTTLEYLFPPPVNSSLGPSLTKTTSTAPIVKMTSTRAPKRMSYLRINGQDYTLIETKWKNDITNDAEIMKFIMKIYKFMKNTLNNKIKKELTDLENRLFTQLKSSDFMRVTQQTQRNGPKQEAVTTRKADVTNLLRKMENVLDGIRSMVATVNYYQNRNNSYSSVPYKDNPIPSIRILLQRFSLDGVITENINTNTEDRESRSRRREYVVEVTNYEEGSNTDSTNNNFVRITKTTDNVNTKNIIELFKQIGETPDDNKKRKRVLVNYFVALFEDLTFLGKENNENYNFFSSKVPLLTAFYAMVKQINDERHFSEYYIKNMLIIDTSEDVGDKKIFDSAPKEYREFVAELNKIVGTLRLSNRELQQMMVDFARGKSTVSVMIPFLGFLIDNEYVRDDYDLVKQVREGNGAVFDSDIFDSNSNKYEELFKRCLKSGYKIDAANNVVIDVYVDLIFGKFASKDLPVCKIRDAILGNMFFKNEGAPGDLEDENKFLDERLDPYLGTDPEEAQLQMQMQEAPAQGGRKIIRSRRCRRRHKRRNNKTKKMNSKNT
jgi:hypothetical protein